MAEMEFEEALSRLEEIVKNLEGGQPPLKEALRLFEEGIRLSRFCSQRLEKAEKRIEILLKNSEEGEKRAVPFVPEQASLFNGGGEEKKD